MGSKGINRRDFIVKTGLGIMTAGLPLRSAGVKALETDAPPKIVTRPLGKTGLEIPLISFGVMNSDSPDLLRKALDMGIKHLDTAHVYLRGNSEKVIGRVLEEEKARKKVYVSTKILFARDEEKGVFLDEGGGRYAGASEENLNKVLDKSLERLKTDYLDILYLHNCFSASMVTYEPLMKAFVKIKEAGKARFIGVTTHRNEPETIRAAADAGIWDVILTSYNFIQKHKKEMDQAIDYAAKKGLGIIAMKTQGGARLHAQGKIEVNHGAALKWVFNNKNICTAIPGITTYDQMALDFGIMGDLTLSGEEKRDLMLSSLVRGPLYCQQCGSCVSSCSQRVEIPTLMRAYMYAEGYENHFQARWTMDETGIEHGLDVCSGCSDCTASCPNGINIHERLDYLMTMKDDSTNSFCS